MRPDRQALLDAQERIASVVHRTPVLTSQTIDDTAGARLFFKCENLQRTGSFKLRGATNAIARLTPAPVSHGVATHSSGNYAQALAYAVIEVLSGSGRVWAYASVVDNGTSDPTTIPVMIE